MTTLPPDSLGVLDEKNPDFMAELQQGEFQRALAAIDHDPTTELGQLNIGQLAAGILLPNGLTLQAAAGAIFGAEIGSAQVKKEIAEITADPRVAAILSARGGGGDADALFALIRDNNPGLAAQVGSYTAEQSSDNAVKLGLSGGAAVLPHMVLGIGGIPGMVLGGGAAIGAPVLYDMAKEENVSPSMRVVATLGRLLKYERLQLEAVAVQAAKKTGVDAKVLLEDHYAMLATARAAGMKEMPETALTRAVPAVKHLKSDETLTQAALLLCCPPEVVQSVEERMGMTVADALKDHVQATLSAPGMKPVTALSQALLNPVTDAEIRAGLQLPEDARKTAARACSEAGISTSEIVTGMQRAQAELWERHNRELSEGGAPALARAAAGPLRRGGVRMASEKAAQPLFPLAAQERDDAPQLGQGA